MKPATHALVALAAAAALAQPATEAHAQTYPSKHVRLVVGFAPGGPADVIARIVGQKLAESLKQPVVVENRPGAGGTIGAAAVASSPPDGYTILFVTSGHAGSAALYSKLPYDSIKSFAPVVALVQTPVVVVVNSASQYRSIKDLVGAARATPGKLNYGAGGGGATLTNLAAEALRSGAKLDVVAVPYKGSGPALTALMGGEIDFAFDTVSGAIGQVKSGKLRALAVTSKQRSSALPDVPTVAETVLPGFEVIGWFGILAPAGTPAPIVDRLNRDLNAILQTPETKDRLKDLGTEPLGGTPAEFGKLVESETARWGEVIRKLGIKAD
jgi:tripartite-type tricarboxylate transporter receptor subunit TctC